MNNGEDDKLIWNQHLNPSSSKGPPKNSEQFNWNIITDNSFSVDSSDDAVEKRMRELIVIKKKGINTKESVDHKKRLNELKRQKEEEEIRRSAMMFQIKKDEAQRWQMIKSREQIKKTLPWFTRFFAKHYQKKFFLSMKSRYSFRKNRDKIWVSLSRMLLVHLKRKCFRALREDWVIRKIKEKYEREKAQFALEKERYEKEKIDRDKLDRDRQEKEALNKESKDKEKDQQIPDKVNLYMTKKESKNDFQLKWLDNESENNDDNLQNMISTNIRNKTRKLSSIYQEVKKRTFKNENQDLKIDESNDVSGQNMNDSSNLIADDDDEEEKEEEDEEEEIDPTANSNLNEYDKFYKELFFRNEIFKLDGKAVKDTEDEEIIKELQRVTLKKKIKEKERLREVQALKQLDLTKITEEIRKLKEVYNKKKNVPFENIELQMNNTDALLYKGRLLFNYFNEKQTTGIPKFSIESEKNVKGKEIIKFKQINKEEKIRRFYDKWWCLKCRKSIFKFFANLKYYLCLIIENENFDRFSLLVIVSNTVVILISDPRDDHSIANKSDDYFWYFYTFEALLKILSFGFIFEENAYMKDYWNVLDFLVILLGWISFILEVVMNGQKIAGWAGLRAFRILRPLKTVKSIKGLKNWVIALLASIAKWSDTSIVLFFFFLIFAIAGVQMWQGLFLRRCMSLSFGYFVSITDTNSMCTFDSDCEKFNEPGNWFICAKGYRNPQNGVLNFDNTWVGFMTVFIIATLEGWSDVWIFVSSTFKDKYYINPFIIFFYFHVFIFVGGFYLINLFLAVTNSEFTKIEIVQKEASEKPSFFNWIKSKYDWKEKEKLEKKRKEKEMKWKNQDKNWDSLTEWKYKIQDEAFHIHKNAKQIPVNYSTVKDIYILQNNNPKEIYTINEMIDEEEDYLCSNIKEQVKGIDHWIKKHQKERAKMLKQLSAGERTKRTSTGISDSSGDKDSIKNFKKRKAATIQERLIDKIYPQAIEISINTAKKFLEVEMVNRGKAKVEKKSEFADGLKQKIEKREMEKFNMNQISLKEDWSFELEKRKEKEEQNKKILGVGWSSSRLQIGNAATNPPILNKPTNGNRQSNFVPKEVLKQIYRKAKYTNHIEDELSFMTDWSISNDRSFIDNSVNGISNVEQIGMINPPNIINQEGNDDSSSIIDTTNNNILNINDSVWIDNSNTNQIFNDNSICATKKAQVNTTNDFNNKAELEVAFQRPKGSLAELWMLQKDEIIQDKLNIMRKEFNVDNFLMKEAKMGTKITNVGRRRSFLKFLQFNQDNEDWHDFFKGLSTSTERIGGNRWDTERMKLDISLNNNDDKIFIDDDAYSEYELKQAKLPEDNNKVYDDNFDMELLAKKIEANKFSSLARRSFLEKKGKRTTQNYTGEQIADFYSNINSNMNDNIIIDLKDPRGRGFNKGDISHIYVDAEGNNYDYKNPQSGLSIASSMISPSKDANIKSDNYTLTSGTMIDGPNPVSQKQGEVVHLIRSKSIDNINWKYPEAGSKELIVKEINARMRETLTPQQETIPDNLKSKKYYMNYLYNIMDKDLKVKDDFKIDQWRGQVLGRMKKEIRIKPLPESNEAVYVFNDKELNLKKYKYLYNNKFEYLDEEFAVLTHNWRNLPINVMELMPPRVRAFGKDRYDTGALGIGKSVIPHGTTINPTSQGNMTSANIRRSKSTWTVGSAYNNTQKVSDDIRYKKGFYDKIYTKIDSFNYKTLSHYFLEEDNLIFKLTDDKRREEKERELEEINRAKENKIEVKGEIKAIRIFDLKTNSRRYNQWSGQNVWYHKDNDKYVDEFNTMISSLEEFGVIIWKRFSSVRHFQKLRYGLYLISTSTYFDLFIMLLVIVNAILMSWDGNFFKPETYNNISVSNYPFNSIFIAEFFLKLVGLGPIVYFSDAFTYWDVLIIAFAILDMSTETSSDAGLVGGKGKNLTSQLSFLRVFRIFRVLRLTKILRKMKSMRLIIVSIKKSLANVSYIILIWIMFLLIFQLLGMSLLNGDRHYQQFLSSFYTTFQVLTTENWNSIFYELYQLSPFSFFYYLIWIFIGNYILFNLFISILLQAFEGGDDDEDDVEEDDIIEQRYQLPNYFIKWKEIEKEHKNRLRNDKRKKKNEAKQMNNNFPSKTGGLSNSQSRWATGGSVISGSTSEGNISNSSIGLKDSESDSEAEIDTRTFTDLDFKLYGWKKINHLFRKNECESALYLLSQTNLFRIWCMKLITNKKFDNFIWVMILLSTVRLIADTFIAGYTSVLVFDMTDIVFNIIFMLEMIFKIFALGFIMDEGSYLRDNWNQIDLVIVVVSVFDFQSLFSKYLSDGSGTNSLNFLKVLRLLRTLRPLRFISHNVQLKLIITSLFDSIIPIINALFIVVIVFFMFSIVGMNLFYSLFHNCYIPGKQTAFKLADVQFSKSWGEANVHEGIVEIQEFCGNRYNGILDTGPNFKFSNILLSLVTSYVLGNMEGWPDIMNSYTIYNSFYGLFFVFYLLIVSYFFLNLFTGIMFKYFNDAWSREKKVRDDDKHANKYNDFLQQVEFADPDFLSYLTPAEGSIQHYLMIVASSKILDNFIMIIIFLNLIVMAMSYDGSPTRYSSILDNLNLTFTAIFMAECWLKLCAYGIRGYFHYSWNCFDFFVVVASIIDLIFANIDEIDAAFLKSFQIIRVLRVLRVTRVLRLVKSLKSLEKLIQTLRWSVTALSNVFILMFLIFCIFAILGCYWYDGMTYKKYGENFIVWNNFYNFDNFYNAFITCFRCATGEDWPTIMWELAFIDEKKFGQPQAYWYMIFMNFISAIIMLNWFLMVTLQQYDEFTNKTYNPVEVFESFLINFQTAWNKYSTPEDQGLRIKKTQITNFFLELQWKKLQFPEANKTEAIKKYISDLRLISDPQNFVYFHDVLFKVLTKQLGQKLDRTLPSLQMLIKEEKKIADRITKKTKKLIQLQEADNKGGDKKNNWVTFNPLTSHLYYKISYWYFKTFIMFYKENAQAYQGDDESQSMNISVTFTDNASIVKKKTLMIEENKDNKSASHIEGSNNTNNMKNK